MNTFVRRFFPRPLWNALAYGRTAVLDVADALAGRRDPLVPPRRKVFIGGGDFRATGEEFFGYFRTLLHLRPDDCVLDVGCGQGRMAVPLTRYLSPAGRYEGFDIVPQAVEWCTQRITARFPNFRFQVADIENQTYNPRGRARSVEYRFPYQDQTFDAVLLTSVFTHMLPPEVEHYLSEIRRVLKPRGRVLSTFFLLDEESEALIRSGRSTLEMVHPLDSGCRTINPRIPADAIAYPKSSVLRMAEENGLRVSSIAKGSWSGRAEFLSYQDIVILESC